MLAVLCCLAAGPLAAQTVLKHVPEVLEAGPMRIDRVKDGNPSGLRLSAEEEFAGADLAIHRIGSTPEREVNW